ncbi:MAG: methylenetetrahydromethanopterin dehydrogenase [Alphaproteobacteria bacterium]|nr:methylenetetrahydromethanopterin dehydrogenase [Alphaproteobacteria bacterium]
MGNDVAKNILHMFSPLRHMSPFDVNMALDAGYDNVIPYTDVQLEEIRSLVQDAMFSRSPKDATHTGVFIAGRDVVLALDMLEQFRKALLPPFEISVFADPSGAFTTAAAMVASVEKLLHRWKRKTLKGIRLVNLGSTGPVGYTCGVIAALEGAEVLLTARDIESVQATADEIKSRFGVTVKAARANSPEEIAAVLQGQEVVLATVAAGVQVLSSAMLASAKSVCIAADVNAVPPAGIEGIDLMANGTELAGGKLGIGPLTIGDVKYKTEAGLFQKMVVSPTAVSFDFRDAFRLAREFA